jgi:phosphotransferase system  glucose/maltose/N-acetylglucosamine-specific IIC component
MKKFTKILISIICLLTGIIIGFLISPIKGGIGNNAGNTFNYYGDKKEGSENSEN